jgi:hypothetical protein
VFDNPAIRTKIQTLFGPDWTSTSVSGLSAPVPAYFARSSAPQQLRIDGADWVAVTLQPRDRAVVDAAWTALCVKTAKVTG